jgi:uncharacterized protein
MARGPRGAVRLTGPDVYTEDLTVTTGEHRLAVTRVGPSPVVEPTVLTLHGLGSTATRHTVRYVLDDLARCGLAALCFEFSGNGDSTGRLAESSLRRRRDELLAVAARLDPAVPPVLVGTSMGAHLAAWTVPILRPRALVLFAPAAYPAGATDHRFDGDFPRPGDHADSPAFSGIAQFDGDLLVVAARDDHVVPADVALAYQARAVRARSRELVWLDDCDHFVHRRLPDRPRVRDHVLESIRRVVGVDHVPV